MSSYLFLRIVNAVEDHDNYFRQRKDTTGRVGLSSLQNATAFFQMLAYGLPADTTDEYIKIGESTAIESMKIFCRAIVEIFSEKYLRSPTPTDVSRLLKIGEYIKIGESTTIESIKILCQAIVEIFSEEYL